MKIKSDFITNSSSTCFFFIFKSDRIEKEKKQDLYDLIRKYSDIFEIDMCDYGFCCNAEDIISSIFHEVDEFESIDKQIKKVTDDIKDYKKDMSDPKQSFYKDSLSYILKERERTLKKLMNAKEKGLNNIFIISYDDHNGGFSACMDYERPSIEVDDFYLLYQSQH